MTLREWLNQWFLGGPFDPPPDPVDVVRHVLLGSDVPGIHFRALLTIRLDRRLWEGNDRRELETLIDRLRSMATQRTSQYSVTHGIEVQDELNAWLACEPLLGTRARANIVLSIDEAARASAMKHVEVRRARLLDEERLRTQIEGWTHLRDQVLQDPGMARLWWLEGRSDRLKELLTMGDVFEQVSCLLFDAPKVTPDDGIARLLQDFLSRLTDTQQQYLLGQVARVFQSYEQEDLASEMESFIRISTADDRASSITARQP